MRNVIRFFSIFFCIALVFVAGCAENEPEGPVTEGEAPGTTEAPETTEIPEVLETPEATETPEAAESTVTEVEEVTLEVLEVPESVRGGDTFNIRWRVSGGSAGNITDTRILSGPTNAGPSIDAYPSRSLSQSGTTPQDFEGSIVAPAAGNLYFRVYAVVDGTEIISDEKVIDIRTSYQY